MADRIDQQIRFLTEADLLKHVDRANVLMDASRPENTAEHCWHLALWAMVMAEYVPENCSLARTIEMALLHDLVEIDAGDHPIHLPQDYHAIKVAERAAADRIFALLPDDQNHHLRAIWEDFEAGETAEAQFATQLDMTQPLFQALNDAAINDTKRAIVHQILTHGRARALKQSWPHVHAFAMDQLSGGSMQLDADLTARLDFLAEADKLKSVLRGTSLNDGSRHENSAEHSWHIALYAMILAEHANKPVNVDRVIQMLLIHDLVEIDAGDVPIHSAKARDASALEAIEKAAADRIFGILPDAQATAFRALWDEFEDAQTDDAIFAKSIDRMQPVVSNLESGGASWIQYLVTREQVQSRVGDKVNRGATALWAALENRIDNWFIAK